MNQWMDVHTHLNMLETSPEESVQQALAGGVERMITIGTCPDDLPLVLELAQRFSPHVYCTLGVHPHDAKLYDKKTEDYILDHLADPRVIAVGEIGLDYYYGHSPVEVQKKVFERQLEISVETGMPVEIHTRDAEEDTLALLKSFGGKVKGLLHCFTGTQWLADEALSLGLNISISGVVTFNKAEELRGIIAGIPLGRIHVETDAPFLTPAPFRGKKNTPAYVVHVAEKVAELKSISVEELALQTKANALALFHKLEW